METHKQFKNARLFWNGLGYKAVAIEKAVGHARGSWVLSTNRGVSIDLVDSSNQIITLKLAKGDTECMASFVYASLVPTVRAQLWNLIGSMRDNISICWLLMGDFNEVLKPSEVRGYNFCISRAMQFEDMLNKCSMVDLGATGNKFTRHRNNSGVRTISKMLDKAVAGCSWRTSFTEAFVKNPCRLHSDHHPVRFNEEVFGNIFRKMRYLEARIYGVQRSVGKIDSARLCLLERELQNDYNKILYQEELLWYQKSREKLVWFGDRNMISSTLKPLCVEEGIKYRGSLLRMVHGAWTKIFSSQKLGTFLLLTIV